MIKFTTGNAGKLKEAQEIITDIEALDLDLPEIQELDAKLIIEAKLKAADGMHKGEYIVEDTSLYFDGLNGLPGPLIKWFLKSIGNEGLYKMAKNTGNLGAKAKTMIGHTDKDGNIEYFEGVINGTISEPKGTGFGWDPIFIPEGQTKTFGELSLEEKNLISMRKQAFQKLKDYLK